MPSLFGCKLDSFPLAVYVGYYDKGEYYFHVFYEQCEIDAFKQFMDEYATFNNYKYWCIYDRR